MGWELGGGVVSFWGWWGGGSLGEERDGERMGKVGRGGGYTFFAS